MRRSPAIMLQPQRVPQQFFGTVYGRDMRKTLLLLILAASTATLVPSKAQAQYYFTGERPNKIVNIKAGIAYQKLHTDDETLCTDPSQLNGVFGLQTAYYPFTAEIAFYTDISLELYAGGYWPITRVGPWGWLVVHGGLFWRTVRAEYAANKAQLCRGSKNTDAIDTAGFGATVEYLMYDGYLGFFLEGRQSFLTPVFTTVTAGIDISPLLWLMFRNY